MQASARASGDTIGGPVSVVIPTYNRADQLARVLGSYLGQRQVKEVIVVDNGTTDRTVQMLQEWAARDTRLRAVRLDVNRGQTGARNAGAAAAIGDFVFFGEDDYELTAGQIATLLDHLEQSGADIIAGRRINVLAGESREEALVRVSTYTDPLIERWAMVGNHHVDTRRDVAAPLLDACALIRREVFQHVSFDPGFRGNGWREESDFQIAALEAGFKLVHCPHALGFHRPSGVGSAKGGSRNRSRLNYEIWVMRNNGRFLQRHWTFFRSPRSDLKAAPTITLTVAIQALLRGFRGGKKMSRQATWRIATLASSRSGP